MCVHVCVEELSGGGGGGPGTSATRRRARRARASTTPPRWGAASGWRAAAPVPATQKQNILMRRCLHAQSCIISGL